MTILTAIMTGALFASGIYMTLSGSLFRLVLGLSILSQGANLIVFASGGLLNAKAPFIVDTTVSPPVVEPLSQALILTAIVIGFAMTAFLVVLARQTYVTWETDDLDTLTREDA